MKREIYSILIAMLCTVLTAQAQYRYHWSYINASFDSIANILDRATFDDTPRNQLTKMTDELLTMAQSKGVNQLMARAYYWKAWVKSKENINLATQHLDSAFHYANPSQYNYDNARMLFLKGTLVQSQGGWSEAYLIYKEQEKFFKQCGDYFSQAKVNVCIGTIMQDLNEYNGALSYYTKGDRIFKEIECINCQTKNRINISNILYLLDNKEDALTILEEIENNPITTQDTLYMANVLISLYRVSDQLKSYAPYKAHRLVEEMGYTQIYSLTLYTMGMEMANQHKNDSALYYYRKAWAEAQANNDVYRKTNILKGLSSTHSLLHNPDSAYHYLQLAYTYQDSLIGQEKILEMNRRESLSTIERYETQLREEHKRNEYQRNISIMICVFLALALVMICYIYGLSQRKARMSEQLKDAENRELQLLNNQFRMEIESKNRELASNTLIIAQNKSRLKELYEKIEQLQSSETQLEAYKDSLKRDINTQILAEDDWQYFLLHFEQAHPHFLQHLKEHHSTLSEHELRLCAYIRIGMSSKEIAQIVSVQPETINTARYRIRKKLSLSSGESLEDMLRNI